MNKGDIIIGSTPVYIETVPGWVENPVTVKGPDGKIGVLMQGVFDCLANYETTNREWAKIRSMPLN